MAEKALEEKNLGNEAYKKKDFATAHVHYDKAIELDPTNMAFYTNKAACFFEEQKYDECIETCNKAIEVGREHRADFSLIAKAYSRIGNAHLKKGDKKTAVNFYEKSLSEHRDIKLVQQKKQLEKEIKDEEQKAYLDPEASEQEKNKGNDAFKNGDYPNAMKHYNEAIKRNPGNAVLYSNRSACYTKLMEFHLAIADCDTCIKLDPTFLKAYLRKGAALVATHEYDRAQKVYEEALMIDPTSKEAQDGLKICHKNTTQSSEKTKEQAMNDPEIQAILGDPSMRMILEQMSQDPGAAREHLKNPDILMKIMKLKEAGIVGLK